jgi:hypothetical protein
MFVKIFKKIKDIYQCNTYCKVCNKRLSDIVNHGKDPELHLCREHALEKFISFFLNNSGSIILCSPILDSCNYPFYSLKELENCGFEKNDQEVIHQLINSLNGRYCFNCSEKASVMYIPKNNAYSYKTLFISNTKYDAPDFLKMKHSSGDVFCKKHALEIVIPYLKENHRFIDCGGLGLAPSDEDGIYIVTPC